MHWRYLPWMLCVHFRRGKKNSSRQCRHSSLKGNRLKMVMWVQLGPSCYAICIHRQISISKDSSLSFPAGYKSCGVLFMLPPTRYWGAQMDFIPSLGTEFSRAAWEKRLKGSKLTMDKVKAGWMAKVWMAFPISLCLCGYSLPHQYLQHKLLSAMGAFTLR